jgi:hypothetical protein
MVTAFVLRHFPCATTAVFRCCLSCADSDLAIKTSRTPGVERPLATSQRPSVTIAAFGPERLLAPSEDMAMPRMAHLHQTVKWFEHFSAEDRVLLAEYVGTAALAQRASDHRHGRRPLVSRALAATRSLLALSVRLQRRRRTPTGRDVQDQRGVRASVRSACCECIRWANR